jgi:EPS-associated MarR family transcriptional regulator
LRAEHDESHANTTVCHYPRSQLNALAAATQPVWLYGCGGSVRESPCKLLKNKTKIQDEARFQILRLLHENPDLTQRELGERVGVSLGAVNYCLKALMERGLVKAGNFSKSPNKLGYAYVLTPAGIAEKTVLTGRFLMRKKAEYEALRAEIEALSREAVL